MNCNTNIYNKKLGLLAYSILVGVLLCGCAKTQVDPPTSSMVSFLIEWPTTKADEAKKTGIVYLYSVEGGEPIILSGVSDERASAPINVPEGDYNVLVYNENLSTVQTRNHSTYGQLEAFLTPETQAAYDASEQVIPQADYLYALSGNANRVVHIGSGESYDFKLRPAPATKTFRFIVTVTSEISISNITAALTGVASRLNLSQVKPLAQDIYPTMVPLRFQPEMQADDVFAMGSVETFGVDPEDRSPGRNLLIIEVTPTTPDPNLETKYEYDLTREFDALPENSNLDILIELGEGPEPEPGDRVVLKIKVTIKPWIPEDGGSIESNPKQP